MALDARIPDTALAAPGADRLDVVLDVIASAELSPTRRRDLASAVRRVAAALGRDPRDLPADPVWLRPQLSRIAPARLGLAPKSWTNILSDFRMALTLSGVSTGRRGRGRSVTLPPAWQTLQRALTERRHRIGLSRLMQFCANIGIGPSEVSDSTLVTFRQALERAEIRKDPANLVRETIVLWNQMSDRVPAWPPTRLAVPDRRNRVVLPREDFSAAFRADVDAYLSRLVVADLFDPDAPAHRLAPETVDSHRRVIWRFASALVRQGRPPETLCTLADLVKPDAVRSGLRFLLARNGGKPSGHLATCVAVLKAIARWHAQADAMTLADLAEIGRKVAPRSGGGLTPKNRSRLRQFDDEAAIGTLLALPDRLVARAAQRATPAAAARDVEMALAISLLVHCPLRIENLRTLDLARHFVGRPGGSRRIVIPAEEVKNGIELDFPLPPPVRALLERFVASHRRVLNPDPGDALFALRDQPRPVSGGALGQRITTVIARETGLEVNPHLFRHISAKIYLRANPGAYEVVRRLLGHSQTSSTVDCYAGFETDAATQAYAAILETVAARAPRRGRRR